MHEQKCWNSPYLKWPRWFTFSLPLILRCWQFKVINSLKKKNKKTPTKAPKASVIFQSDLWLENQNLCGFSKIYILHNYILQPIFQFSFYAYFINVINCYCLGTHTTGVSSVHTIGVHKLYVNLVKPQSNSAASEACCRAFPDFTVARAMLLYPCLVIFNLSIKHQRSLLSFHDLFEISL